jgi:hypothetical protein
VNPNPQNDIYCISNHRSSASAGLETETSVKICLDHDLARLASGITGSMEAFLVDAGVTSNRGHVFSDGVLPKHQFR